MFNMVSKTCLSLLIFVVAVAATDVKKCFSDAQCGENECCFRHEGPMIVSRRQLHTISKSVEGVCEKYQVLGDLCSPFDKVNGHCSCGSGMDCHFVPAPSTTMSPKRKLYYPGPGDYRCAPIQPPIGS